MNKNDSMIEIAMELMQKKKNPHTIVEIAKEVFQAKGLKISENPELLAQFYNDFMLCGYFICCQEDNKGNKVDSKGNKFWDIKTRQSHDLLDKEGIFLEDPLDNDDEVKNNELMSDEYGNIIESKSDVDSDYSEDGEEEKEEKDDIEEELELSEEDDIEQYDADDDEIEEDSYDDEDDTIIPINPKKK